jgi:hypothetical protein
VKLAETRPPAESLDDLPDLWSAKTYLLAKRVLGVPKPLGS